MPHAKKYIALTILLVLLAAGQAAAAPLVNMNVVNTEVRDVLTALASVGGVSIVADDSAAGKITIHLVNVPFETALDLVTKTKGLVYQRMGHVIVVATPEKLSKGFGNVQIIKINYAKAAEIKKTLALIIPEDRLKVDEATNSIVFSGSPAEADTIRSTLDELDVPYRQISLEAQVVALNKNASKDLGIDWKWEATPSWPDYEPPQYTNVYDASGNLIRQEVSTPAKITHPYREGMIRFGSNSDTPTGAYYFYYQAKISALISDGKAKILAKPNVTTIDGKEATILIGDRIPVLMDRTENGKTITTIEYVEAGIKLKYTPRINADGQITATVHTEVSTPTLVPEMKAYRITTREAATNIRMKDGETMVIGGLIGSEESGGKNRVPGLADLPILGKLFESVHKTKTETEVMIFLTARIVK